MKTIHHVLDIAAEQSSVFEAVSTRDGLAGWWSTAVELPAVEVGAVIDFTFVADFHPDMQITALDPPRSIEWRCIAGHDKWADNTFRFEVEALGDGRSRLRFWQHYATELGDDDYGIYNFNWGYYLQSLLELVTTGAGRPFDPGATS